MGNFWKVLGDVGGAASRGFAEGMRREDELRHRIAGERSAFSALHDIRQMRRQEELDAALAKERATYGLRRELEAPQRRQRMAFLQPLLEREGIMPPMDIDQGGGAIPPGHEYFADLDKDLADSMFRYMAAKKRTQTSNQDFMNWLRGERLDISRQNLDLAKQRLDLSKQPPPISEENLYYRANRLLRDQGIWEGHPDHSRLLDRAMEGLRAGKRVRLSRRPQRIHLGTEMPGALGAWLFGSEPEENWGEREVLDVEIGEETGGRMRPPQAPPRGGPSVPPTPRRAPGPISTVTPPTRQPTRPLTPQEEAVLRRLRQGTVRGQ